MVSAIQALPQPPATGTTLLGRYRIGRLLGHGSFAKVHEARSVETGSVVAIKQIDKEKSAYACNQEPMILAEISAMRRLKDHPNIIRIHEVMATKTKIYIVMEFAGGGDLMSKLARRCGERLTETMAGRYFQQLVSALRFCHENGISHRDVKPHNILLDRDGNVKVSDFGLSASQESLRDDGLLHTACGTPAFTAPEVFERRGYDGAKADAWSCGVILFGLLTGFLPFRDDNVVVMYQMIRRRDFKFPDSIRKSTRSIIFKLLDPNPGTRIGLEEVMQTRWFKRHLEKQNTTESSNSGKFEIVTANAFDIISLSSGLDLSGMFEAKSRRGKRFTAAIKAEEVMGRVREIGGKLGYRAEESRGKGGGAAARLRKEAAVVVVEAVKIPVENAVAEVRVEEGDIEEEEWEELKRGLDEIVSSWHNDISF
ncbi:PREDICTED: CBL-interacting serine/threonine-protein kinase 7-like [Tarenaya hassleriana]|uniref:CBL-interacting serine/threonine-protein kinase 7-like n=1 Tax=Tarenaya hassleriana TaxID=28532 RepID=UPI00053C889E|nr:PREDICTED: CBL-interacting serine/threonine-protein kinase 7-like [Tarenaya hassleriana]